MVDPSVPQTSPLEIIVDDPHVGCAMLRFTLDTRHICTEVPLNQRKSYRIDLEWLVMSVRRGRPIGILTQSDHSYRHPTIAVELPLDGELVLVPSAPYLCNCAPVVSVAVSPLDLPSLAFRYELEVGASIDDGIVRDGWSYREGRLAFEHWFHNKRFRWSFDGAELELPAAPGCALFVSLNALCRTGVDVLVDGHKVGHFPPISNWARWHDEFYGFAIPAEIVTGDTVRVVFRYTGPNDELIDFNLRQSYFAVSRVTVDVFGEPDASLFARIARSGWHIDPPPLASGPGADGLAAVTQAAIVLPQVEFDLLDRYIAPHSQFWTTIRGAAAAFRDAGVSVCAVSAKDLTPLSFDTIVSGPLRFLADDVAVACAAAPDRWRGALFTMTTASLEAVGLAAADGLASRVTYQEIFDVPLPSGGRGNFWEFVLDPGIFAEVLVGWAGHVLLGRVHGSDRLHLVASSAEDSREMGDPYSREVLDLFVEQICATRFVTTAAGACSLRLVDGMLEMQVPDGRTAVRSYGGGIARGWPALSCDWPLFAAERLAIEVDESRRPRRGDLSAALDRHLADLGGLLLPSGTQLRTKLDAPIGEKASAS